MQNRISILILFFMASCFQREVVKTPVDFYTSELFKDVQLNQIFKDSKTFVDCTPKRAIIEIMQDYETQKLKPGFELAVFVTKNFDLPDRPQSTFKTDSLVSMEEHINKLWPVLTRIADQYDADASLIPLPQQYVVPGGRFSEVYYWDSYFTMLGLKTQGKYELIQDMVENFGFLIDSLGFIPNGNRNYYLSRSQPPFFSLMVKLLEAYDVNASRTFLPMLKKEYEFWMHGAGQLQQPGDTFEHVVMMADGTIMNRYYDRNPRPRPEAYREDVEVAEASGRNPQEVYTHLRAAAESGWDFSSRWFEDGQHLKTIHTTDIIPVDLNALLYHLEKMIAKGSYLNGDKEESDRLSKLADARRRGILTFCWDENEHYFFDYDFKKGKQTPYKSLAGVYPLFFELVSPVEAEQIAKVIERDFLKPGGLVTTAQTTGQQWDAPNGWAPLQWMAYQGLQHYSIRPLAAEIRKRWIRQNIRVYTATGKMMEKYNVMDTTLVAGGGEYPNQDGFGWTNGVALAFIHEIKIDKQ
ncbi:MAG TPA: alpha,alpha-trehalase TreF [Ohtaekwangia sp.]|nr:alpha,alpha-trehalase TreF [Ohtaekwangia sp.]